MTAVLKSVQLKDAPDPIDPIAEHVRAIIQNLGEDVMRGVGLARGNHLPPPVVPLPDQARIAREGFGRGEGFGAEVLPESVGAAKGRHAARRGHAGARHHGDASIGRQPPRQARNQCLCCWVVAWAALRCAARNSNACGRFGTTMSV